MSTIHARIKQARNEKGLTLAQLGEAVGVSAQAAQQWEDEENGTVPRSKRLDHIAAALGVSAAWLQFGTSASIPPPGGIAIAEQADTTHTHRKIQLYELRLSAGNGNADWVVRTAEDPLVFRDNWFRARQLQPNNLRAMSVKGDSMAPVLNNLDTVIIDISDTELIDGEIYAVVFKEKFYIKQIRHTADGIELISHNPDYPPMPVKNGDADKFQSLGRMVWRGG